jgi:hypothetical protein
MWRMSEYRQMSLNRTLQYFVIQYYSDFGPSKATDVLHYYKYGSHVTLPVKYNIPGTTDTTLTCYCHNVQFALDSELVQYVCTTTTYDHAIVLGACDVCAIIWQTGSTSTSTSGACCITVASSDNSLSEQRVFSIVKILATQSCQMLVDHISHPTPTIITSTVHKTPPSSAYA